MQYTSIKGKERCADAGGRVVLHDVVDAHLESGDASLRVTLGQTYEVVTGGAHRAGKDIRGLPDPYPQEYDVDGHCKRQQRQIFGEQPHPRYLPLLHDKGRLR